MKLGKIEDCSIFSLFSVSSGTAIEQSKGIVPCIGPSFSSSAIILLAKREGEKSESQWGREA